MNNEKKEIRNGIISIISTPIQLAALVVLVVEALLAFLLSKASQNDILFYVIMMVVVLILTIILAFVIEYRRIKLRESNIIPPTGSIESTQRTYKWDAFLAAPMASLTNEYFINYISKVKEIKKVLEIECGFQRIFYAGTKMATKDDFETADISIEADINALKESQHFIMIYPEKIVSSVLFEAGIALALGKPSFYFGNKNNFPFLMQKANQKFSHIKMHEVNSLDEMIKIININKCQLFKI